MCKDNVYQVGDEVLVEYTMRTSHSNVVYKYDCKVVAITCDQVKIQYPNSNEEWISADHTSKKIVGKITR